MRKQNKAVKILFLGTPQFAVTSLKIINDIKEIDISGVVTHPSKPKGRKLVVSPSEIRIVAEELNLPVYESDRVSNIEFISEFREKDIDLIVIVSFGEIISKDILALPKLGCINLHTSLLPKYRGASPVTAAIMNGEKVTGVTTFWITEKMDSGDIIMQKEVKISPSDNKGTLEDKLAFVGAELLRDTLIAIGNKTAGRRPQDNSLATYTKRLNKTDGLIDWNQRAVFIHNKIRAMNPWPMAYSFLEGLRINIWESEVISECSDVKPGVISSINKDEIGVATGEGVLLIKELQVAGKNKIKAVDFVNGYRLKKGQFFKSSD